MKKQFLKNWKKKHILSKLFFHSFVLCQMKERKVLEKLERDAYN